MEVRYRVLEKYNNYEFKIPLLGKEIVHINQGQYVNKGDILFERSQSTLKKSIYIPKILDCRIDECSKYVERIDGEFIEEGEVLARKYSPAGFSVTEVFSPISGVMDLERIGKGYIDFLGEENRVIYESNFKGYVKSINPHEGLIINAPAVGIDIVTSTRTNEKVFGKLDILGNGKDIVSEDSLDTDYRGKIVWVGQYLYKKVAIEIFERGAVGILTYSMPYEEFRSIGLPITVLGGFGSVHCDERYIDRIVSMKDNFVILDGQENQLFIISDIELINSDWFVDKYLNETVISRSPSHYGYIGKVIDIQKETNYVYVDYGKKGRLLENLGTLDFIDL